MPFCHLFALMTPGVVSNPYTIEGISIQLYELNGTIPRFIAVQGGNDPGLRVGGNLRITLDEVAGEMQVGIFVGVSDVTVDALDTNLKQIARYNNLLQRIGAIDVLLISEKPMIKYIDLSCSEISLQYICSNK